jgi:hypothetical protein
MILRWKLKSEQGVHGIREGHIEWIEISIGEVLISIVHDRGEKRKNRKNLEIAEKEADAEPSSNR